MTITYLIGDATLPTRLPALIIHVCNDLGAWGAGFVVPLGQRYPEARAAYLKRDSYPLGTAQFVPVADQIVVGNLIAQHGLGGEGRIPLRYIALAMAFDRVANWLDANPHYSVHAPRLGCGLAGGSWPQVERLLGKYLVRHAIYIYDLPPGATDSEAQ